MVNINKVVDYLIGFLIILALLSVIKYVNFIYSFALISILVIFFVNRDFRFFKLNRKILTAFAFLFSGFTLINTNSDNILLSLCHIIIVFICVKLLEEKGYRDYMQIIVLSIFLTTISGLFNLSMIFLIYIIISVFIFNITAIFLTFVNFKSGIELEKSSLKSLFTKGLIMVFLSIPLAVIIFIVIPRTDYPLFSSLGYSNISKTGFTDKIGLGDVSSIQEDDKIALRVVMHKVDIPLYFRGVVFDIFEKNRWISSKSNRTSRQKTLNGKMVEYEIFLEPHYENFLITVDYPFEMDYGKRRAFFTDKLEVKDMNIVNKKVRYKGVSYLSDRYKDDIDYDFYTDTSNISERVLKFAKNFTNDNQFKTANAIMDYLKNNISYSINDLPTGEDSLEEFLFGIKKGNCEFFASSMAILLRANGIPARLVGGFKGGYYNENGKYYTVFNKNAHVWVEAHIDGYWIRFEPTPASIENFTNKKLLPLRLKLQMYFDYISYYWTKFVINYDLQKQLGLFKNVSSTFKNFNIDEYGKKLAKLFITFVGFIGIFYFLIYRRKKSKNYYYIDKFYKILRKNGVAVDPKLSLLQNTRRIDNDILRERARIFVDEFYRMKFKDGVIRYKNLEEILGKLNYFKKMDCVTHLKFSVKQEKN